MRIQSADKPRFFTALTLLALVFSVVVIVLGAFTRLSDAGLGCPDWPTCYGHLWVPDTPAEVNRANLAYPQTPVLQGKTWPEQIHRILASSLGLICLVLLVLVLKKTPAQLWRLQVLLLVALVSLTLFRAVAGDQLDLILLAAIALYFSSLFSISSAQSPRLKLSLFIAGWVILQGLFGMWTVTLKLWPQVVTAHLFGGFTLVSLLWWQYLKTNQKIQKSSGFALFDNDRSKGIKTLAVVGLLLVVIQVLLGGWTSSNYAALACPDLPLCQGQLWPEPDFVRGFNLLQGIGPNYLGGTMDNASRIAVHLTHRIGAIIVTLALLFLVFRLYLHRSARLAGALLITLSLQVALGISNVVYFLPLPVAVLHNAGAALLLLTLVSINYSLRMRTQL